MMQRVALLSNKVRPCAPRTRTNTQIIIMNMKMYKQPETEVLSVNTERMMQDLNVSINGGTPSGGGGMHAPRHGDVID